MSVESFLDTNVLVYAVSSAPEDAEKQRRALELIEQEDFGLSAQVLQEFFVTVTRKLAKPLATDKATAILEHLRVFPLIATDYPVIVAGIEISLRYGISYWDGAIIAAADFLGATTLFSEDLGHGQRYDSVRVVNPFEAPGGVHESRAPSYR